MSFASLGAHHDYDRHLRRAVSITALLFGVGAAMVYADKAADDRSAFVRWRPQVLELMKGVNIYDTVMFPNPPILPLTLYPLMILPPVVGAVAWFAIKFAMTAVSARTCFRMVHSEGRALGSWVEGLILLLSLRPILSDLHHGNNNLLILFLVVGSLQAWRKGYDVLAGLTLALAITYKVTPALFVFYFLLKRSWRTLAATGLGIGIFLLILPSLALGVAFNGECLGMWWHRILSPYLTRGEVGDQDINQSMVGVLSRLLTEGEVGLGRYNRDRPLNLVAWPDWVVTPLLKALSLGLVGLLAFLCRNKARRRDDPRLFGEFSLVVLTMLFISERSWKHHYVTVLLPYTYLMYRVSLPLLAKRSRTILAVGMALSAILMASTSSELGGLFVEGQGHKIAQGYGLFFASGVVLYVLTAWRVWVEGRREDGFTSIEGPSGPLAPCPDRFDHPSPSREPGG